MTVDWSGTPRLWLIRHRLKAGGLRPWTNQDVIRLCMLYKCTVLELSAMCGVLQNAGPMTWWKNDHWPTQMTIQFDKIWHLRAGITEPDAQDNCIALVATQSVYGTPKSA